MPKICFLYLHSLMLQEGMPFPGYVYLMPELADMYRLYVVKEARKKDFAIIPVPQQVKVLMDGVGAGLTDAIVSRFDVKVDNR